MWDTNFKQNGTAGSSCSNFINEKCILPFSPGHFYHCLASSRCPRRFKMSFLSKTINQQFISLLKSLVGRERKKICFKMLRTNYINLHFYCRVLYPVLTITVRIQKSSETPSLVLIQIAMLMQYVACEVHSFDMFLWLYWKIILLTVWEIVALSASHWNGMPWRRRVGEYMNYLLIRMCCSVAFSSYFAFQSFSLL